uniref:Uncharacterized protein LOC104238680 n=1 Tax=Nicotiana sylvestris TaxID=4096 RepID=A0A1U7XKK4_NICSY|nr:PREDICTED: uncharacterized protein LOC104238680 [Nicotiana sylvestris]
MAVITRSGRGGDENASNQKEIVSDEVEVQADDISLVYQNVSEENLNAKVRIDVYPGAFTIPCSIESADFATALWDLGASINLMPYSVFKTLGIGQQRATSMRLQMVDRTMKRLLSIIDDVPVRVDKFILHVDFVILDCEVDYEVPFILGRPLLATGKALDDMEAVELTFRVDATLVVL